MKDEERAEAYRRGLVALPSYGDMRQILERDIAKAFRVPPWLIGTAPRPTWLRRKVQRWSGYRLWL